MNTTTPTPEYIVRITIQWNSTKTKLVYVQKELRFASDTDAIACRDALAKATVTPRGLKIEIVRAEKLLYQIAS